MIKSIVNIVLIAILFSTCSSGDSNKISSSMTIDLSEDWRFSPDTEDVGLSEEWYRHNFDDSKWDIIDAGKRWEDQGYPNLDSLAWYRKVVNIPSDWKGKNVWLKFGGVNDCYTLFVNGERINAFGNRKNITMAKETRIAEVSGNLKYGEPNLIAIQVYDWGASGGLWHSPIRITTNQTEIDEVGLMSSLVVYEENELWVSSNLSYLGNKNQVKRINIKIKEEQNATIIAEQELTLAEGEKVILVKIPMPGLERKTTYNVIEELIDYQGETIFSLSQRVEWNPPTTQPDENGITQLNNFVDELLNEKTLNKEKTSFNFFNPKDGWVFFSVQSEKNNNLVAHIDKNSNPLIFREYPNSGAYENMQFLTKGEHSLYLENAANSQVIIRSIPELIYSDHPSTPNITPYGKYDWDYLTKHVLSNVNTIITSASTLADSELEEWKKEGRNFIVHSPLVGLHKELPPTVAEVYESFANNIGATDPRFSGIIVDEFIEGSSEHFLAWANAISLLYENPNYSNKTFYAYGINIFHDSTAVAIPFGQKLMENRGLFVMEHYLHELSTEAEAYALLFHDLGQAYKDFNKNLTNSDGRLIFALGYLTDPTESLSNYPSVDYRVFMDMQFHLLATDPTFSNLYGIQEYLSRYADEELLRWAYQLFRHYCIEGKRTRFTDDSYNLPHLQNPDFLEGLQGWTIEPAEEGSIQSKSMPGYSWLHGRWPRTTIGDQFISFKRSSKQPNIIRQKVKELDTTRLYSLKLIATDLQKMNKKQELELSVMLDQVEIIKDYSFKFVYPSNYAHKMGEYDGDNPAWFNYYRIVFRPKSKTAELTISDWSNPTSASGEIGQEMIFNFIEIQPFNEK